MDERVQTLNRKVFSLYDVTRSIKKTLTERYQSVYWIRAEMNKLNFYQHSGHCYPDLVEKRGGRVIAEIRAIIWASDYQRMVQRFEQTTGETLKDGIEILFSATIGFDEVRGLSLRINDIDPDFSLGVLARERQETLNRLIKEGTFKANKQLSFPLLPKRLAIISVETSKGLADFYKILKHNPWDYQFEFTLFPALLQGDNAVRSILSRLEEIRASAFHFDAVAIIRGGGGDVGLACYNDYSLCVAIARFPIPVLTGIGHATNETVSEMVAYKNAITPSELADFLVQHFHQFAVPVLEAEQKLRQLPLALLHEKSERLQDLVRQYSTGSQHAMRHSRTALQTVSEQLRLFSRLHIEKQKQQLHTIAQKVDLLNPETILKRGFSITRIGGKALTGADNIHEGDEVETYLANGIFRSTIQHITKKDHG